MADPAQIEQVLMNMAVNARDAMPNGGELKISTSTVTLGKSATKQFEGVDPGDFVQISVTDNGSGIDSSLRDKVYSPFSTIKARGLGLGLPIAKRAVIDHNGEIEIDTSTGGTTVSIKLPIMESEK